MRTSLVSLSLLAFLGTACATEDDPIVVPPDAKLQSAGIIVETSSNVGSYVTVLISNRNVCDRATFAKGDELVTIRLLTGSTELTSLVGDYPICDMARTRPCAEVVHLSQDAQCVGAQGGGANAGKVTISESSQGGIAGHFEATNLGLDLHGAFRASPCAATASACH